jgi:hypothetical protein
VAEEHRCSVDGQHGAGTTGGQRDGVLDVVRVRDDRGDLGRLVPRLVGLPALLDGEPAEPGGHDEQDGGGCRRGLAVPLW